MYIHEGTCVHEHCVLVFLVNVASCTCSGLVAYRPLLCPRAPVAQWVRESDNRRPGLSTVDMHTPLPSDAFMDSHGCTVHLHEISY